MNCEQCNNLLTSNHQKRFCSIKCKSRWFHVNKKKEYNINQLARTPDKHCQECRVVFKSLDNDQLFCSIQCSQKSRRIIDYPEGLTKGEKHKIYWQTRYKNEPEFRQEHYKQVNKNKQIKREWLSNYKKDKKCINCDENTTCCLDFHHVDSTTKEARLGEAVLLGWSIEHMQREIAKCIILCSNCHRKLHAGILKL